MRVLIIEDEIRLARNIARVLDEESSWAVDISAEGEDGCHMAMTNPYDLIILDRFYSPDAPRAMTDEIPVVE